MGTKIIEFFFSVPVFMKVENFVGSLSLKTERRE